MTNYIAEIETTVAGIPCIVGVTEYSNVAGDCGADSDWDYEGGSECLFDVLDRRGRPAPWLARKLTDEDDSRIQSEIADYLN